MFRILKDCSGVQAEVNGVENELYEEMMEGRCEPINRRTEPYNRDA